MEEVHTVLQYMTEQSAGRLVLENKDAAILDTGCARSVSGKQWIEAHIRSLSQSDRSDIKRKEGRAHHRFGNGRPYKSEELVILPVYFGNHRAIMAVDVVDVKIPLLISLAAMKKANTVIWTATDTAIICGQRIKFVRVGGQCTISLRKGEAEVIRKEENEEKKTRRKLTDEISREEKIAGGIEDKPSGNTSVRSFSKTMEYLVENDVYTEKDFEGIQISADEKLVERRIKTRLENIRQGNEEESYGTSDTAIEKGRYGKGGYLR